MKPYITNITAGHGDERIGVFFECYTQEEANKLLQMFLVLFEYISK